jgi:hypothetical protein
MGIAHVVADHYACGDNQMTCSVGKSLLLMEPTDREWTYVMNPISLAMGFVPTACLEPFGKGLGVVIREVPGVEHVFLGDCVGILEDVGTNFEVETAFGARVKVSKGIIGLIHS